MLKKVIGTLFFVSIIFWGQTDAMYQYSDSSLEYYYEDIDFCLWAIAEGQEKHLKDIARSTQHQWNQNKISNVELAKIYVALINKNYLDVFGDAAQLAQQLHEEADSSTDKEHRINLMDGAAQIYQALVEQGYEQVFDAALNCANTIFFFLPLNTIIRACNIFHLLIKNNYAPAVKRGQEIVDKCSEIMRYTSFKFLASLTVPEKHNTYFILCRLHPVVSIYNALIAYDIDKNYDHDFDHNVVCANAMRFADECRTHYMKFSDVRRRILDLYCTLVECHYEACYDDVVSFLKDMKPILLGEVYSYENIETVNKICSMILGQELLL